MGIVLPEKNPILSMVTLLGAAIATGNAVIMVPSQKYPLPALAFIQVSVKTFNVLRSKLVQGGGEHLYFSGLMLMYIYTENTCIHLLMYL